MIIRDAYGVIVQHDKTDKSYLDGGDSCARTGIMSGSGSKENVVQFIISSEVVRHPYQVKFNKPKDTSRDNVVQFFFSNENDEKFRKSAHKYAESWFINKDFLSPSVRLYFYKKADYGTPAHIFVLGYLDLFLSTLWNGLIETESEKQQFTAICITMGPFWIKFFNKLHPNLEKNITEYYSGWRDQPEIAVALISKMKESIAK